ncbi:unnamed protein product, partial [Discosporangium mesarthrocarpum]
FHNNTNKNNTFSLEEHLRTGAWGLVFDEHWFPTSPSSWTKHIQVRCHFLRELINDRKIFIKHVSTQDKLADILTKFLTKSLHGRLCQTILTA